MRRLFALLIVTVGLSALSGCALSIHPLHSKETVQKGRELNGDWIVPQKGKNVTEVYEIDARPDNSYDITYIKTDRGEEVDLSFWRAHLVRLGEAYYLDAQPVDFELAEAPSQQFYVMGLHALFRIEFKRARRSNCCRSTSGRSTKRSSKRKPITS